MENSDQKALEDRLAHQGYNAIDEELSSISSGELFSLLDSKSRKIGDTAAEILQRRKETALVLDALVHDRIHTVLGRVRATNILNAFGLAVPEAINGYVHVLGDRSNDVVSNALFGIVFMRRSDLLPELMKYLDAAATGSSRQKLFSEAIDALKANDPFVFSPGFSDTGDVWRLNKPK